MLVQKSLRGLLVCAVALASCHQCAAVEYYVRKSGDDGHSGRSKTSAFQTIQQAAQTAQNGDTIYIGAGTYERRAEFDGRSNSNAQTRIIADRDGRQTGDPGKVVLKGSANYWALVIVNARKLTIEGFAFTSQGTGTSSSNGCRVSGNSGRVTFSNCYFEDQSEAIRSEGSSLKLSVANCQFQGGSYGVIASHSGTAEISACTFRDVANSSYFHRPSSVAIFNCEFSRSSPAALSSSKDVYVNSGKLTIENCDFTDSNTGVFGTSMNSAVVDGCVFTGTKLDCVKITGTRLKMSNCRMLDGNFGLTLNDTDGGSPELNNIVAERMQAGLVADLSDYSVRNINLKDNNYGILQRRSNKLFAISRTNQLKMHGNQYAIYTEHQSGDNGRLKIHNQDFRNNRVGIYANYTAVDLNNCKFGGSGGGLFCNDSTSVSVRRCDFGGDASSPNTCEYGLFARSGNINIRDTKSRNARHGIYIDNTSRKPPTLLRVLSENHAYAALFMRGGTWRYSGANRNTFRQAEHGIIASDVSWTIDNVVMANSGCKDAIVNREGDCSINALTVTQVTGDGFRSENSNRIVASGLRISGCGQAGIRLWDCDNVSLDRAEVTSCKEGLWIEGGSAKQAVVTNCTFSNNTQHGIYLGGKTLDPTLTSNVTLSDNAVGIEMDRVEQTINAAMHLEFSRNDYAIRSRFGSLNLDAVTIEGNKTSVHTWQSNLTVKGCKLISSSAGVVAYTEGECEIVDSTIEDSAYGILLYSMNTSDETAKITGLDLKNISHTGIYASRNSRGALLLDIDSVNISGVVNGVVNKDASLLAQGVTMDAVSGAGFHLGSETTNSIAGCEVKGTGSNWGILSYGRTADISQTRVDNSARGVAFFGGGGSLVNSVINNCQVGVQLSAPEGQFSVQHSTIANITDTAILLNEGSATVSNSILVAESCSLHHADMAGAVSLDHNIVYSPRELYRNTAPGSSDINKAPVFIDSATGDLRLAAGSPAINSASETAGRVSTDFAGNRRPSFRGYEIGAYEYMNPGGSLRILDWDEVAKQ